MALMVETQRSLASGEEAARIKDSAAPGCLSWTTKTSSEGLPLEGFPVADEGVDDGPLEEEDCC